MLVRRLAADWWDLGTTLLYRKLFHLYVYRKLFHKLSITYFIFMKNTSGLAAKFVSIGYLCVATWLLSLYSLTIEIFHTWLVPSLPMYHL